MDTLVQVKLVIKGDALTASEAVTKRINAWFLEDATEVPPFDDGSLLHWRMTVESRR